ncbi:hypothetical protein C7U60_20780 [Mesorhizobium plurifarium]|nr:hypothetical protein C7U60_20780 [Mesorhizobium plurifarium]
MANRPLRSTRKALCASPLTLTLSPRSQGEGTRMLMRLQQMRGSALAAKSLLPVCGEKVAAAG